MIDPFNQVVKTVTPDEESASVTVVPKSASLNLKLSHVHDVANPGGYQEWVVFLLAFHPGANCTISIKIEVPRAVRIQTRLKNVSCTETGETYENPFFNPGEQMPDAALHVLLKKTRPWWQGPSASIAARELLG